MLKLNDLKNCNTECLLVTSVMTHEQQT